MHSKSSKRQSKSSQRVIKEHKHNEQRQLWEFAGFQFDPADSTLRRDGEVVPLSPKSLELLELLASRSGEIISKQEIFDTVWAGTFVEDGVLTQNVYTLRQALGKDGSGKQLIENVARRGYRMNAVVTRIGEPEAGSLPIRPDHESSQTTDRSGRRFPIAAAAAITLGFIALAAAGYFAFKGSFDGSKGPKEAEIKFSRLTDTGDITHLAISPDGRQSAFTQGSGIRVRDLESGAERKIEIEGVDRTGCIQFSPDGFSIYFGTIINRDEKGTISRVPLAGGSPQPVAADVWTGFSVSPDGKELAFVRKIPAENRQVLIRKNLADGSEKIAATIKLPEEFYWNNYPAWSADGRKIALTAVTQTEHLSRIVMIEDGRETEIKPANFRNIEQVVWNAAGDGLIASGNEGTGFQIWRIALADGSTRRVTNDLNSYLGIAASLDRKKIVSRQRIYYSNIWVGAKDDLNNLKQMTEGTGRNDGLNGLAWLDEERLVYTSNDERIRDWNLWLLNTGDGTRKKLTNDTDVQNDFPAVSPDGRFIYFASDRNKQRRIWRIDADGEEPTQVTFGENEAHLFPQVSPDGTQLFFIIKSGRTSNIGRASLSVRSVQELSGRSSFVPGNLLSISPDGKFVAFQDIGGPTSAGGPSNLVQLAIMSTEDPNIARSVEIATPRPWVQWSRDGHFLDFIGGSVKQTALFRRTLDGTADPAPLSQMSQGSIFAFAWSPSGEKIAVSRGQLLRDVVLLSDAER